MKIRDHAKGKWPRIIGALLGDDYADVRKHFPCPGTGEGQDRFRFSDIGETGQYFCACSDGDKDGFELIQCAKKCTFAEAARLVEGVIGECPQDGTPAPKPDSRIERIGRELIQTKRSKYLENRGLEIAPALRWHKRLTYYVDGQPAGVYPAMVAPVTRAGKLATYHATYLQGGDKAPVTPARKLLSPAHKGAIELYPAMGDTLGIAEGIETAIAAKLIHRVPTWAAINTSLLKSFEPPAHVKTVLIFADNDANHAGQAAAYALSHRLRKQGLQTEILLPGEPDTDFNDELLSQRASA